MIRINKLVLYAILSTSFCLMFGQEAAADVQVLANSLNSKLSQVQFAKQNINTVYGNAWNNSYQISVTGDTMVVQYSEDTTFSKNGVFKDRVVETGSYTIDLSKVDINILKVSGDNEALDMLCRAGQQCVTQDFEGIIYRPAGVVKTTRQGSEQLYSMSFFLGNTSLLDQVLQELQQLILEVQQTN